MTVLVFGATGRHGSTGQYLVRRLLEQGRPVRALVRGRDERAQRLVEMGAEIAVGDLTDRRTLVPALTGVDTVYFTYPIAAGVVPAAAHYASAVLEAGTSPRTVVMSMGPAHRDHPSRLGQAQWLAEQVLEWAGLDLLILRVAALFHENVPVLHADTVRRDGTMRNSFGRGPVPWISGRDAAEIAVAAILHPERFAGPVVYPGGTEMLSHDQIAGLLTEVLGHPVLYEPVSAQQWRRELEDTAAARPGEVVNAAMAQHISSVAQVVAGGGPAMAADPATIAGWIGRQPVGLREFLRDNAASFR